MQTLVQTAAALILLAQRRPPSPNAVSPHAVHPDIAPAPGCF